MCTCSVISDNSQNYCTLCLSLQDGVWIKGLFLEGAGWDKKASCLVEANPMQLVCPMPTIHFKPVETKRRSNKGKLAHEPTLLPAVFSYKGNCLVQYYDV